MKKLLSIGLAAMLAFGLATTSFAAEASIDDKATDKVTMTKKYTIVNEGSKAPAETFIFNVEAGDATEAAEGVSGTNMPMIGTKGENGNYTVSVPFEAIEKTTSQDFEIALPACNKKATKGEDDRYTEYPSVGVYTYYLTEADNGIAGVTYDVNKPTSGEQRIKVVVTVAEGKDSLIRVVGVHAERPYKDATNKQVKTGEVENKYEAGKLTVTKKVAGTMGDTSKKFAITVTLTSAKKVNSTITYDNETIAPDAWAQQDDGTWKTSVTVNLADKESSVFTNIPYGVVYSVSETKPAGYEDPQYAYSDVNNATNQKMDTAAETATVTNTKNGNIDTGVVLNNMPYILVLAVLAAGVVVFIIRKRRED